ncbi:MAG: hypothetical protein JSR52_11625 [Planctomycetes bacterium]|nr:hypothetical protein [Planctomycetota bacterium]
MLLATLSLGLWRRSISLRAQADLIDVAVSEAMLKATGIGGSSAESRTALDSERSRLLKTRTGNARRGLPPDASIGLAALLGAWPEGLEVRTQTIAATAQGITVAAEVPDQSCAQQLAKGLAGVDGWSLQSPRTHANGKAVRFDATLQRSEVAR